MRMVTLTTDLGHRDPYLGLVKAALLTKIPGVQIIDLSNDPRNHHLAAAGFIISNSIPHFPEGTIHLCAIRSAMDRSEQNRSSVADHSRFLVAKYRNQYVLTADNGLFTLMDNNFNGEVFQVFYDPPSKRHFYLKEIFVDVAAHIEKGLPLTDIATPTSEYIRSLQFEGFVNGNVLRGKGIYVDDFGNIVTNIRRSQFESIIGNKRYTITLPGTRISRISDTYDDVRYGSPLVLFNSFDYLEVAVNGKSAFNMLCPRDIGAGMDFNLIIEFYD